MPISTQKNMFAVRAMVVDRLQLMFVKSGLLWTFGISKIVRLFSIPSVFPSWRTFEEVQGISVRASLTSTLKIQSIQMHDTHRLGLLWAVWRATNSCSFPHWAHDGPRSAPSNLNMLRYGGTRHTHDEVGYERVRFSTVGYDEEQKCTGVYGRIRYRRSMPCDILKVRRVFCLFVENHCENHYCMGKE